MLVYIKMYLFYFRNKKINLSKNLNFFRINQIRKTIKQFTRHFILYFRLEDVVIG